ncbi:MAG: GTPase HflX [Rhodospirillales bacterium]
MTGETIHRDAHPTAAAVIHPFFRSGSGGKRLPNASLEEAIGLAEAIGLDVRLRTVVTMGNPRPATLLGSGKVAEIGTTLKELGAEIVVIDAALTPGQQRNLERDWDCKVIDRTGLILEIFGARARTREGRLQVELASLNYQKSRLVRSWTHLERQRGGFGFMGGPGERQIEADRRMIAERITRLEKELKGVSRTRTLHRESRRRVPFPTVAFVGYTNAGKSTLFNRLTAAEVLAKDMLFATLDPTMRGLTLPGGERIILSDTVGFVSNLPHDLVAAFAATLEEVRDADVILHVRDMAHPDNDHQKDDVLGILKQLGLRAETPVIEVQNKIDLLPYEEKQRLAALAAGATDVVTVSAATGEGCGDLLTLVGWHLRKAREVCEFRLPSQDGSAIAWLHEHGEVTARHDEEGMTTIQVALYPADARRFERRQADTKLIAAD